MVQSYIYLVIKQIGELKEILSAHDDWKIANEIAKKKQDDIHSRGYTDFKVKVDGIDFFQHKVKPEQ